jgi:hypothetical protein
MKKRAHISIDTDLYQDSARYARQVLRTDFTGLVVRLLVEELNKKKLIDSFTSSSDQLANELVRRAVSQAPVSSAPDKILAEQEALREAEAAKSRGERGKRRSTGRAVRVKTGLRHL